MSARSNLLVIVAVPIATLPFACGSSNNKASPDAPVKTIDAPGSGSGSGSGSGNLCPLPTNLGTITTFPAQVVRYRSGLGSGSGSGSATRRANRLSFTGALDGSATEQVQITIYGGCGSSGSNCSGTVPVTPDWPTTFGAKSGLTFGQAVDISALAVTGVGSNTPPSAYYLITSGGLDVTAAGNGSGAPFAGQATNLTFVHVDIGSAGVTPDPDGCTATITSMTFSGSAAFAGKVIVLDDLDTDDNAVQYLHHRYQ